MRGIKLKDMQWVAHIEYENHPDSFLTFSTIGCLDIFSAIAHVHRHVQEHWPYEIISISQKKISK